MYPFIPYHTAVPVAGKAAVTGAGCQCKRDSGTELDGQLKQRYLKLYFCGILCDYDERISDLCSAVNGSSGLSQKATKQGCSSYIKEIFESWCLEGEKLQEYIFKVLLLFFQLSKTILETWSIGLLFFFLLPPKLCDKANDLAGLQSHFLTLTDGCALLPLQRLMWLDMIQGCLSYQLPKQVSFAVTSMAENKHTYTENPVKVRQSLSRVFSFITTALLNQGAQRTTKEQKEESCLPFMQKNLASSSFSRQQNVKSGCVA